jgi:uncharacterized membrane protein YczE
MYLTDSTRLRVAIVLTALLVANLIFYVSYFGQFEYAGLSGELFWIGLGNALFSVGLGIYVVAWRARSPGRSRDLESYSGD